MTARSEVGGLLQDWRQRRRLSQLDLAVEAEVSARHLSFVETGRSRPSRELLLHLAEHLDVPLRERNTPAAGGRLRAGLPGDGARRGRDGAGARRPRQDPHRPRAVPGGDRRPALGPGVGQPARPGRPHRRRRPRAARPAGQRAAGQPAPRRPGAADRQPRRVQRPPPDPPAPPDRRPADPELARLYDELRGYPGVADPSAVEHDRRPCSSCRSCCGCRTGPELSFFSTLATFGTALDITVAELAIESFFPADEPTARALAAR